MNIFILVNFEVINKMDKRINTRVLHKHDIESNWQKAQNFIPLKSEIIIYDEDENYSYKRIKIGDGETGVNALPFYSNDWNNLQNRPFYEEGSGDTITWDGNTEGKDYVGGDDGGWCLVSELTPSANDLIGSSIVTNDEGVSTEYDVEESWIMAVSEDVTCIAEGGVVITYKDNVEFADMTFPKAGTYFSISGMISQTGLIYNQSLTYGGGIKQLDEKFIPDTIARVDEIEDYINNVELITVEDIDAICGQTIQVETLPNAEEVAF